MTDGHVDNPFQAPTARVADRSTAAASSGTLRVEPRRVSSSEALSWLGRGWDLFKASPGAFIGILVVAGLLMFGAGLIPILGMFAGLLYPIMLGGLMLGCRALARGGELRLGHLFAGFQEEPGKLFMVGLINFAMGIGLMAIVGLGTFGILGTAAAFGSSLDSGGAGALATGGTIGGFLLLLLAVVAVSIPMTMAAWFAPALVALHQVSPLEAMKMSFNGCLRNAVPFLVYGLALTIALIVAVIPLGLGLLVFGPVAWASIYYSYLDIFEN